MATEELFREDADLAECEATVVRVDDQGLVLDRTVFYPLGGGQAGDRGELRLADGTVLSIADTRKGALPGEIVHVPAPGQDAALARFTPGVAVRAAIESARRQRHRRFHTATHLLCALVPHPVNGCSITAEYARLDFHMTDPLDKAVLTEGLATYVAPLDHRGRARRQSGPGAQHERAAAARPGPGPGDRHRGRRPAALRRHPRRQHRRHRRDRRGEDRKEVGQHPPRGARTGRSLAGRHGFGSLAMTTTDPFELAARIPRRPPTTEFIYEAVIDILRGGVRPAPLAADLLAAMKAT